MAEESLENFRRQITCSVCSEYMVQPTKLIECFHTFCFTCIEKHLEKQRTCPDCVSKVYERDIERPSLYRSLVVDKSLEDIIKSVLPDEAKECIVDDWFTKRNVKLPVRRSAHLTDKHRSLRCPNSNDWLSIHLNCVKNINLEKSIVLFSPNSTISDLRKDIANELFRDASMFEKITLSVKGKKLEDDLTMIAIFVHYFKYQAVPMPFDLKIET